MENPTPLLEYIEGRDFEAETKRASLARLLKLTEDALRAKGIGLDTPAGKIMRLVVRVAGLGVLRRTRREIAEDPAVACHHGSVARAVKQLEEHRFVRRGCYKHAHCHRVAGLILQADLSAISDASELPPPVVEHWCRQLATGPVAGDVAGPVAGDVAGPVAGDVAGPVAGDVAGPVAKSTPSLYPSYPITHSPSSSTSLGTSVRSVDVDDEDSKPSLEQIGRAAVKLRDSARRRSPKRAEEAREDLWLVAYVGLAIDSEKLIEHWVRAANRKHPEDFPDYFLRCAKISCHEHGIQFAWLRERCPPCPRPSSSRPQPQRETACS
ncbi:hypothetical protein SH501x_001421 [Pirellulaceae bacterium SH501]